MAMKTCSCGNPVHSSARRCPHCGAYRWSPGRILFAFILLVPMIFFFMIMASR